MQALTLIDNKDTCLEHKHSMSVTIYVSSLHKFFTFVADV